MHPKKGKNFVMRSQCQSYIAPEDVKTDTVYAFTLNPDKSFQFLDNLKNRFRLFKFNIINFLKNNITAWYVFYIEKSSFGQLHIHGKVRFRNWEEADSFYDFLSRLKSTGKFAFKFGECEKVFKESGQMCDTSQTWSLYIRKQVVYWDRLGFQSRINCTDSGNNKHTKIDTYFQKHVTTI